MSTNLPAARTYGQLQHRRPDWAHRYAVAVGHLGARQLAEYLELLELIYEHTVLLTNKPDQAFLTLTMAGRTEAGLRFASWLYGVSFTPLAAN